MPMCDCMKHCGALKSTVSYSIEESAQDSSMDCVICVISGVVPIVAFNASTPCSDGDADDGGDDDADDVEDDSTLFMMESRWLHCSRETRCLGCTCSTAAGNALFKDVAPFEKHGYQSRFGDGRDRYVDYPVFHRTDWTAFLHALVEITM